MCAGANETSVKLVIGELRSAVPLAKIQEMKVQGKKCSRKLRIASECEGAKEKITTIQLPQSTRSTAKLAERETSSLA